MITLTDKQVSEIKALHVLEQEKLLEVVGGEVNAHSPKPITEKYASCLVAQAINLSTQIMMIINKAEE